MEVLDFLYSSTVWMTVILIVVLFLCVGFAFANPFKNKKLNYAYKIFLYVFAFCFMMSFQLLYYGYTAEFKSMHIGKTTICLFEQYERGGEGPSEHVCRLHIIERATGIRKTRYYIGPYGGGVDNKNDTLCYLKGQDVILFDAANLKEIYTITQSGWDDIRDEFSVGMESISAEQGNYDSFYVLLVCKNGKRYWFDPFSKKVFEKEPPRSSLPVFSKTSYNLSVTDGIGKEHYFLTDAYAGNKLKRIVPGEYGKRFFTSVDSTTYIDPFFLGIDTLKKVFVFGHYFTTDRNNFYVEAKDFDFKTKWKKSATDIAPDDEVMPKINVWQYLEGVLYFNSGGFVIAIDPLTGKVAWTSRL